MAALTGPRAHLQPIVMVALGTGRRMSEQLQMKRHQVDFLRNIVTARHTKNGRPPLTFALRIRLLAKT